MIIVILRGWEAYYRVKWTRIASSTWPHPFNFFYKLQGIVVIKKLKAWHTCKGACLYCFKHEKEERKLWKLPDKQLLVLQKWGTIALDVALLCTHISLQLCKGYHRRGPKGGEGTKRGRRGPKGERRGPKGERGYLTDSVFCLTSNSMISSLNSMTYLYNADLKTNEPYARHTASAHIPLRYWILHLLGMRRLVLQ